MSDEAVGLTVDPPDDEHVRIAALDLLEAVWLSIDHDSMQPSRRMGLWDELVGRVRSAARAPTLTGLVETLARKLGITALRPDAGGMLLAMGTEPAAGVLTLFRAEPLVLVAELRARRDLAKERRACSRPTPRS